MHTDRVVTRDPAPSPMAPPSPCLDLNLDANSGQGRTLSIPSPFSNRGFPGLRDVQYGDPRALHAHFHGAQGTDWARHPDPALQGALVPLLPSPKACSTISGAPRARFLSVPGRATASPSPKDAEGRPPHLRVHRLPQLRRLRVASWPSPGARTLLSICFTILAVGGLTNDCCKRRKRIRGAGQS